MAAPRRIVDNNDDILVSAMATVLVGNAAHRGAGATASAYATGIQQYAEARTYDSTGTGPNFTSGGGFTVGAVDFGRADGRCLHRDQQQRLHG